MVSQVQLQWVNHASYTLKYNGINLIVDPWLYGSAFDDGWDLLVESQFTINDFDSITHIWFSHEHPDHFSPLILSKISEAKRKNITVLFQETTDKRVVSFCEKLSFNIMELSNRESYILSDGFEITCGKMIGIDSWLLCNIDGVSILNLNDCVINSDRLCRSIKETTGEIDILLSQFSYANWIGNPEDIKTRELSAREKLDRIKIQIINFNPKFTIPFASFIYFSHEENKYLNDSINTVEVVNSFISNDTNSQPLVFYPGDIWDCISPYDNKKSLIKYKNAYNLLDTLAYRKPSAVISEDELLDLSKKYLTDIKNNNSFFVMKLLTFLPSKYGFKPILIKFMDKDGYCLFSLTEGLVFLSNANGSEDVKLSTCSLKQILKFPWGIGSILVNGRYRASKKGNKKLSRIFMLGLWNSIDKRLTIETVLSKIIAKITRRNISTEEEYSFYKSWNRLIKKSNK